jgi:hypothetical protein
MKREWKECLSEMKEEVLGTAEIQRYLKYLKLDHAGTLW